MIYLTIITPTYNREETLKKLYISLCNQTSKMFKWIIVDDGSTDNSQLIADKFIKDNFFEILYHKRKNSGKHKSINWALQFIDTELVFIVDSDDYLLEDAVEIILNDWSEHKKSKIVSLQYLKAESNGILIGNEFKVNYEITTHVKSRLFDKVKGDKAEIWKTEILRDNKFIEFENEKFLSEQYSYFQISGSEKVLTINKIIYFSEYRTDGLSNKIRYLQFTNPNGAIENAIITAIYTKSLVVRLKQFLMITALSFRKTTKSLIVNIKRAKYNLIWLSIIPLSILFYYYLKHLYQKNI